MNSGKNETNANPNNNDATAAYKAASTSTATKTVLKYSEKNPNMYGSAQTTEITQIYAENNKKYYQNNASGGDSANDSNNDYFLSNQLNEISLSNSIELNYFVFHNDKESVLKYIEKYKKKLEQSSRSSLSADKNNNNNSSGSSSLKVTLSDYLSIRDVHGNTPLHIATMMGHSEILKILLENGAVTKCRNKNMWTPLNEAISFGNREMIKSVLEKFEIEVEKIVKNSKPKILSALKVMDDFYVEITWNFESWIPIVSRFLPSDICKLYKHGAKLRLECTLGDIAVRNNAAMNNENGIAPAQPTTTPFNWQRGDFTFLFDIETIGNKNNSIVFLDNKRKTFVCVDKNALQEENIKEMHDYEKEVDMLLSREMLFLKLQTKTAAFLPTQSGWFIKKDKIEQVNGYTCQFYDVNGLFIVSKLRSEHMSEEELKLRAEKQKKVQEQLTRSKSSLDSKQLTSSHSSHAKLNSVDNLTDLESVEGNSDDFDENIEYRPSLPPPEKPNVTWNEYINSNEGKHPTLGRALRCKESKKEFKAQLAMSEEFPLTIKDLNELLDALVPLAKFRKLKEFINLKLPPGFPVKIDIPIVPTVTAKVSFKNFNKNYAFNEKLFKIPDEYVEEESVLDKLLVKDKKTSNGQ